MNNSLNAKVEQAIWSILQVYTQKSYVTYTERSYVTWANNWLNGTDRSSEAAFTAYIRAMASTKAAADARDVSAAYAAADAAYLAFASAIAAKTAGDSDDKLLPKSTKTTRKQKK